MFDKKKNNQSILDSIHQLVRYYRIPTDRKKEDVLNTILIRVEQKENKKKKSLIKLSPILFTELAAALVILVLAFHFFTAEVILSGKNGEKMSYRLPDHSRVVFNDNSDVRFSKYFWNRKVSLNGTAYFEVEKGDDFKINAKLGSIEVLGTRFLVSEEEDSLNVLCYEGRVKTVNKKSSFILDPGSQYAGTKLSGKKVSMQAYQEYPDFARFSKSFSNVALNKVIKDLEAFFAVQIDIKDANNRNFAGIIQTGKLESALEIVCQSMQLKYRYTDKDKIVIFK